MWREALKPYAVAYKLPITTAALFWIELWRGKALEMSSGFRRWQVVSFSLQFRGREIPVVIFIFAYCTAPHPLDLLLYTAMRSPQVISNDHISISGIFQWAAQLKCRLDGWLSKILWVTSHYPLLLCMTLHLCLLVSRNFHIDRFPSIFISHSINFQALK